MKGFKRKGCNQCESGFGEFIGKLGKRPWFKCRQCGWIFSSRPAPAEDETEETENEEYHKDQD